MTGEEPQQPTSKDPSDSSPQNEEELEQQEPEEEEEPENKLSTIIGLSILVVLALVIWFNFPIVDQLFRGRYTPTPSPLPPTPTRRPTRTPTMLPSPTISPTVTPTPYPASAYLFPDPSKLDPPLPNLYETPVVMGVNQGLIADPSLDSPRWLSSQSIAEQLHADITEPYYATFGLGSAQWKMDVPLKPGYYEIYVLDTIYSSGGSLDYHVYLGATEIQPILGQQHVEYRSSKGENAQDVDLWHSIGLYYLDRPDMLTVATSWTARDENTIVAIGRMVVAHLPDSAQSMLATLQRGQWSYVVDDLAATIKGDDLLMTLDDTLAWGGQLQMLANPNGDEKVTWALQDKVAAGKYEVFVWVPALHNKADVIMHVFADTTEITSSPLLLPQSSFQGGQWVSLGTYDLTSPIYSTGFRLSVQMDITGGTVGEISLDAVAFTRLQ